jgi:hypothetical protein
VFGSGLTLALSVSLPGRGGGPVIGTHLLVDVNTAPPAVLLALPRLGPALVDRIVAERQARPFRSLHDLDRRVPRVGPATVQALAPYLEFGKAPAGPATLPREP